MPLPSWIHKLTFVTVLAFSAPGRSQTESGGSLDLTFGQNGVATIPGPSGFSWTQNKPAMLENSDGSFLVAGIVGHPTSGDHVALTRLTSSGVIDSAFGTAGFATVPLGTGIGATPEVRGLVRLVSTGKLIVGISRPTSAQLVGLTANGTLDTGFGSNGFKSFTSTSLNGLSSTSAGLSAFGSQSVAGLGQEPWHQALTERGEPVGSGSFVFGISGPGDQEVTCTGQLSSGAMVAVGHSLLPTGARSIFVAQRFTGRNGVMNEVVIGFNGSVSIPVPAEIPVIPKSFTVDPLDEYVIFGERGMPESSDVRAFAIRLGKNGAVATDFASQTILPLPFFDGGTNPENVVGGLTYLNNRQIMLQTVKPLGGKTSIGLTRFFWNGSLDISFGTSGRTQTTLIADAQAHQVVMTGGTKIAVLGTLQSAPASFTLFVARYHGGPSSSSHSVTVSEQPQNVEVTRGNTAAMTFLATSLPSNFPLRYLLKKNGVRVGPSKQTPSFTFPFDPALEANYSVEITNGFASAETTTASLYVRQSPHWVVSSPLKQSIVVGTTLTVSPEISGRFPMTYIWRKMGGPVLLQNSFTQSYQGPNIIWTNAPELKPARFSDTGLYELTASNIDGESSVLTVEITVLKDPTITSQADSMLLEIGASSGVWAQATASTQTLVYTCLKNGRSIPIMDGNIGVDLPSVTLSDAGTYVIKARSVKGVASSRPINVCVFDPSPGWRVAKPSGSVTFEAVSAGKGMSYAWFKDGQALADSPKHRGTKKKLLTLTEAELNDAGVYVCEITAFGSTKRSGPLTLHLVNERSLLTTTALPAAQVGTTYSTTLMSSPLTSRFSISGLPKGLTLNSTTGHVSGVARVPGDYKVTVTCTNPWGRTVKSLVLRVDSLPANVVGRFIGLPGNSSTQSPQIGVISLTVSKTGSVSGSVSFSRVKGSRQTIPFRAILTNGSPGSGQWQSASISFRPSKTTGFTLGQFDLFVSEANGAAGVYVQMYSPQELFDASVNCIHVPWHTIHQPVTTLVGNYNLGSYATEDEAVRPTGHNFTRMSVRSNGLVTVSGLLCDGSPLVASSWLTSANKIPLHTWLYGYTGFHRTTLSLTPSVQIGSSDTGVNGKMLWFKQASATLKGTSYPSGFTVTPDWYGSNYLPPNWPGTSPLMLNAPIGEDNLLGTFINNLGYRFTRLTLTTNHQAQTVGYLPETPDRIKELRFNSRTGQCHGTWIQTFFDDVGTRPRWRSTSFPFTGLVVRTSPNLHASAVGFCSVPVLRTVTDSNGRQHVKKLFEPASVEISR